MHVRNHHDLVSDNKVSGAVYTPKKLADFVSQQIIKYVNLIETSKTIRILDPALGDGELLVCLLNNLDLPKNVKIEVYGFEIDSNALHNAKIRLEQFPNISVFFKKGDFLEYIFKEFKFGNLPQVNILNGFDIIIANPPYVRTQILGTKKSQLISKQFDLSGRIDLYYPFVVGISKVLRPNGIAGIIVSNRFMTTKSGSKVRNELIDKFDLLHTWDLGDTKLFSAAILPAVLVVRKKGDKQKIQPLFTTIYETSKPSRKITSDAISALNENGIVKIRDGRNFQVKHGKLDTEGHQYGVWRLLTKKNILWLRKVEDNSKGTFRDIGKIRVGVKTCADKIFIRNDWNEMNLNCRPELLKPLSTHHNAQSYKTLTLKNPRQILYPHEVVDGQRKAVDLTKYPCSHAYLLSSRKILEKRKYLIDSGRKWYEIWVPQDPDAWKYPKLVFNDIADQPKFWMDFSCSVVNGDCYWIVPKDPSEIDLLWLAAAIGNSSFIIYYYDLCFNNKLYAGRRRFITQYVEKFPLLDVHSSLGQSIVQKSKQIFELTPSKIADSLKLEVNSMIWKGFTGNSNCII